MSPGRRRIPMTPQVVEMAMVDLITPKIRHVPLMLTKVSIQSEICQTCFFEDLPQYGILKMFALVDRSCGNLYPCFWKVRVPENKQVMTMGNVGKNFVFDLSHVETPLSVYDNTLTSRRTPSLISC